MSPYSTKLAEARLDALRALIDALNEAESPDEKRRCAVAIFNAPDPCELDDSIELDDEDEDDEDGHDEDEVEDSDQSDDDSDEDSEEEDDSVDEENPSNSSQLHPAFTSDIAHPTSDIPSHITPATALLNSAVFDPLVAPP